MIILPAKLSELTGSSKANSTGSSLVNSSPGSTQTRQTSKRNTINHVQSSNNMMQTWDAMWDAICDAYARFDKEWKNLASTWKSKCATGKMRWNRLKTIWRTPESELPFGNGKQFKYDTGLRFTASSHLNATRWTFYNTQTWHQNTWQETIHEA